MDIVFFGSGKFAVRSLEALVAAAHKVKLVVTQPDRPKGRHLNFLPTEVKVKAQELKLNIYQPQNPNSEEALGHLKQFGADLFIVIAYGHILKESALSLPKLYPLNVHASLLPKYRGAAPINWAIINGEKESGISIIKMNETVDAGDSLLQKKLAIEQADNADILEVKLEELSALSLIEALDLINKGQAKFTGQDDAGASFAPKLEKHHGLIDWNKNALDIVNQIRGLVPWPVAWTYYQGKILKIYKAEVVDGGQKATPPLTPPTGGGEMIEGNSLARKIEEIAEKHLPPFVDRLRLNKPGEVLQVDKRGIRLSAGGGALKITELQMEGGRRLDPEAFLCGHKLAVGDRLG